VVLAIMDSTLRFRSIRRQSSREEEDPVGQGGVVEHRGRFDLLYKTGHQKSLPSQQIGHHSQNGSGPFSFLQVSPIFYEVPSSSPSTLTTHRLANEHDVIADCSTAQTKELLWLYERLNRDEFRAVLIRSLARLAGHIQDDPVFLNLTQLGVLPMEDVDNGQGYDSDSSWTRMAEGHPTSNGASRRASGTLLKDLYRALGGRQNLSAMVFILGMKLVQIYRQCINQLKRVADPSTPTSISTPSSMTSSTHSTATVTLPADVIRSPYHLVILGLMLANKYTEDRPHSNASWAHMTGMPVESLNRLEQLFLRTIRHRMFMGEGEFVEWMLSMSRLLEWVPHQQRTRWETGGIIEIQRGIDGSSMENEGWLHMSRFARYVKKTTGGEETPARPSPKASVPPNFQLRQPKNFGI